MGSYLYIFLADLIPSIPLPFVGILLCDQLLPIQKRLISCRSELPRWVPFHIPPELTYAVLVVALPCRAATPTSCYTTKRLTQGHRRFPYYAPIHIPHHFTLHDSCVTVTILLVFVHTAVTFIKTHPQILVAIWLSHVILLYLIRLLCRTTEIIAPEVSPLYVRFHLSPSSSQMSMSFCNLTLHSTNISTEARSVLVFNLTSLSFLHQILLYWSHKRCAYFGDIHTALIRYFINIESRMHTS